MGSVIESKSAIRTQDSGITAPSWSLHFDTQASASPFPSPSSSFLPPPVLDAHEFAIKLPPRKISNVSRTEFAFQGSADSASVPNPRETEKSLSETIATNLEAVSAESTVVLSSDCMSGSQQSRPFLSQTTSPVMNMHSPTTPTLASLHLSTVGSAAVEPLENSTRDGSPQQSRPTDNSSSLTQSQALPLSPNSPSLSSIRPAPLSPAASRRTSTISARSSKSIASSVSNPPSRNNSRRQSKRSSNGLSGLSLVLNSVTGVGAGVGTSNKQSMLSALNTDSRNQFFLPQIEGDEDAAANVKTPTVTTPSSNIAIPISMTDTANPAEPTPDQSVATSRKYRRSTKIKIHIRDFAFKKSDDRYRGVGFDVPKPNHFSRLNKKLGGSKKVPSSKRWSITSESTGVASSDGGEAKEGKERRRFFRTRYSDDDDDDDDDDNNVNDDDDNDGWFRRGMGRFSWAFGLSNSKKQEEERQLAVSADNESYPSRDEMDFNFGGEDYPTESGRNLLDVCYYAEDIGVTDLNEVDDDENQGEDEELLPGEYRAAFAFEPEGTAEMRLVEDQVVQVVGRGGGVGWAVVVVPDGADGGVEVAPGIRHALVPESYLEAINLN